jgi:PPOX class probable F420-dependent enzyme
MTINCAEMSEEEIDKFLLVPRFAVVATNRQNGPPQQTPVWYLFENGKICISMFARSAKYKNLCRDPRASICIAGEHPDARAVILSGQVELFPAGSAPWVDDILWKIVRRYYDNDKEAELYIESSDSADENVLAVLTPAKILAQNYN